MTISCYLAINCATELEKRWFSRAQSCGMAAAYWAVMCHPATTPKLMNKTYAHVEISALRGLGSAFFTKKRSCLLREELEEKEDEIANMKRQNLKTICRYGSRIHNLENELCLAEDTIDRLKRQIDLLKYRSCAQVSAGESEETIK